MRVDRGYTLIQASTLYWDDPTCAACADKGMGLWITEPAASGRLRLERDRHPADSCGHRPAAPGVQRHRGPEQRLPLGRADLGAAHRQPGRRCPAGRAAQCPDQPPGTHLRRDGVRSPVHVSPDPTPWHALPTRGPAGRRGQRAVRRGEPSAQPGRRLVHRHRRLREPPDRRRQQHAGHRRRAERAIPAFLAVTSATADIGLGWNRPPDPVSGPITGYRVSYVPVAGGTPQSVDVTGPDTTSTTITGLTLGTPYRFTVAPLNVAGQGSTVQRGPGDTPG